MIQNNLIPSQLAICLMLLMVNIVFTQPSQKSKKMKLVDDRQIISGQNTLVSAGQTGWEHQEYMADWDPSYPNRIMICSMRFSQKLNQLTAIAYITNDDGRTWKIAYNDDSSRFDGVWDPTCSFGTNEHVYLVTLLTKPKGSKEPYSKPYELWGSSEPRLMNFYSSAYGSENWAKIAQLSAIDQPMINIDRTNGPFRGRMYINGNIGGPPHAIWIIYSKDGGRTWNRSAKTVVEGKAHNWGRGTILPGGTMLLPYYETPSNEQSATYVSVASSGDGGGNLSLPVRISKVKQGCYGPTGLFAMTSDHSLGPFRGRAYIAWAEITSGRCSVMVSHSDDKGLTWSSPVQVCDVGSLPPNEVNLMPQIATNNTGVVGVAWYEPIKSQSGVGHWLMFSASLDGGESWIPAIRVSTHPFLERSKLDFLTQTWSDGGGFLAPNGSDVADIQVKLAARTYPVSNGWPGDYAYGLISGSDSKFHAFWIDNRTGTGELYTAPIIVKGKVGQVGGDALKGLDNVTSALVLQVTSSVWNPIGKTLSLKYQFQNISQDTIKGPLRIRLLGVDSQLGTPKLIFTKRIHGPTQDLLDASDLIARKGLSPGEITGTQRAILWYDEVNNLSVLDNTVASLKLVVYGKRH